MKNLPGKCRISTQGEETDNKIKKTEARKKPLLFICISVYATDMVIYGQVGTNRDYVACGFCNFVDRTLQFAQPTFRRLLGIS